MHELPRLYIYKEYLKDIIAQMGLDGGNLREKNMFYRLAQESDIDEICELIKAAICSMEERGIFQWDDIYPAKEDFLADIQKKQLYVGVSDDDIAVVYTVNEECEKEYQNGRWKYPDCKYRILHRLCVDPVYQNRGIAKNTLSHIEKELHKLHVEAIRLDVFSKNPFALSLYRNAGYDEVGFADWRKGRFYLMEKLL